DPYIMRDLRGQVVEVYAFQYNPVQQVLRIYTSLTVEVYADGIGGANVFERTREFTSMDPEFRQIYRNHFLNFDETDYTPVDEEGPLLVIVHDAFYDAAMPLVNWKNQKGLSTTIELVSVIGNNSTAIKNRITTLYNAIGLKYVLLVGDAAQVATPGSGLDPTYGQITGGDHYPELFIGRFSAESLQDVNTQVVRTVTYEKLPMPGAAWYHKGFGVASNEGPGHYGEYDYEHVDLIRGDLLHYGYTLVDQLYQGMGGSTAGITNALNDGRSIGNYCGHGSTTSWGSVSYSNSNVNSLVNENMLPFITSVACLNGNFAGSTCFGEAWLRATNNGQPTGAIGFWGSSMSQSWSPPMYAQDEVTDLLVADSKNTFGGLCFNGGMLMIDETGSTGENEFDHWIIFGDPSVQVRTATPTTMTVIHDNQVAYGQPTFEVTVTGIQGALAALSYQGELLGNGVSNASGVATITITGALPQGGYVTLTVSAYNHIPYIVELPVNMGGPDIWPPLITHTPLTNTTSSGPYTVNANCVDYSGVASASVYYSTDGVMFVEVPMTNTSGNIWSGDIPGQPVGTTIDYYIEAVDASPQANVGTTSTWSFGILGILFFDDMENGVGSWTHEPVSVGWVDQWHQSTEMSHSATHAWKFGDSGAGNYADHADGGLMSPVISIGNDCVLSFYGWIAAEASGAYPDSAYDGGTVEISHNGGPWTVLSLTPGYTHSIRATAGGGNPYSGPFTPGTPVFSGTSDWGMKSANLSNYVGDIQLRFRFGSDNGTNNEGWYIDDVMIVGLPSGTLPDIEVTLTPATSPVIIPATGGTIEFNIALTNHESSSQNLDVWCFITKPNGTLYGPTLGPVNVTMAPGFSLNRDRIQNIPAYAPSGNYSYDAYVGVYPGVIWNIDSFPFTKLETGNGAAVGDWNNWGEDFFTGLTQATSATPDQFAFKGTYPNPFNPTTTFSFDLPEVSQVTLKVYNLQGSLVATLVDGLRDAGAHEVSFDASQLASGIYLYRFAAGDFTSYGKLMLVK
ncbi:MAG: C25 family cysteine peptidase, partial [bacterium]